MRRFRLKFGYLMPAFLMLLSVVTLGQTVKPGMYSVKVPPMADKKAGRSSTLFRGSTHDMELMQLTHSFLLSSDKHAARVPADVERLVIVKSGTLQIIMNDSTWALSPGSVALFMPDQRYSVESPAADTCTFYTLEYRSKLPADKRRGVTAGGSIVRDWNEVNFQPHDKGGIRRYFDRPTVMCKRFEMHVTTLNEGLRSHDPHTHAAEEIVIVISGQTEMQIGDQFYKGGTGAVYFLASNVPHAIRNVGKKACAYFAFQLQ